MPLFSARLIFIVQLLLLLPTIGVAQRPERSDRSAEERRAVVDTIAAHLETSYVLADTAAEMAGFLRTKARGGAYDHIDNPETFANQLTAELRNISRDGHVRVRYHADPLQVMPDWNTPAPDDEIRTNATRNARTSAS